ncbi:MAG: YetF domain-containing protein, partial [Actinomycetota bacterium]
HSKHFAHLVAGGPVLLVHEGAPVPGHLRRVSMTAQDLLEALRDRGYEGLAGVREAVLETDGSVSVVPMRREPTEREPPTTSRS